MKSEMARLSDDLSELGWNTLVRHFPHTSEFTLVQNAFTTARIVTEERSLKPITVSFGSLFATPSQKTNTEDFDTQRSSGPNSPQ